MTNNPFVTASRRFSNQESATVHVVRLPSEPVRQFLESVKSVFRTIDFADEYHAKLGRLLWRLRCSVLFGLVPYDHEELQLFVQCEEISDMAERLPGSKESVSLLKQRLLVLLEHPENPKLEWILRHDLSRDEPAAIFTLMAMRKSFGTDLLSKYSGYQNKDLGMITTLEQLGSEEFSTLLIPGTLQYLSYSLFMRLFHQGTFRQIHILLYEGESLSLKERMQLPDSSLFPGFSNGSVLNIEKTHESSVSPSHVNDDDLPSSAQIFGAFVGALKGQSGGCPSRFLLCDDGSGFYVAESDRIRVWRPNEIEKLSFVYPVQLLEGDFVILEEGQRRDLLDQPRSNTDFSAELDATDAWREPLRAMLLASSSEEIASRMMDTGHLCKPSERVEPGNVVEVSGEEPVSKSDCRSDNPARNLKTNISNWAEGQVYGPGELHHLLALVEVLVGSGYLQIESSPEYAARQWFKDLEKLRAGRRAAGMNLSEQTNHMIEESLGVQTVPNDGLELLLDNGMLVSVHQLAMISDQVSTVPGSLLSKPA